MSHSAKLSHDWGKRGGACFIGNEIFHKMHTHTFWASHFCDSIFIRNVNGLPLAVPNDMESSQASPNFPTLQQDNIGVETLHNFNEPYREQQSDKRV